MTLILGLCPLILLQTGYELLPSQQLALLRSKAEGESLARTRAASYEAQLERVRSVAVSQVLSDADPSASLGAEETKLLAVLYRLTELLGVRNLIVSRSGRLHFDDVNHLANGFALDRFLPSASIPQLIEGLAPDYLLFIPEMRFDSPYVLRLTRLGLATARVEAARYAATDLPRREVLQFGPDSLSVAKHLPNGPAFQNSIYWNEQVNGVVVPTVTSESVRFVSKPQHGGYLGVCIPRSFWGRRIEVTVTFRMTRKNGQLVIDDYNNAALVKGEWKGPSALSAAWTSEVKSTTLPARPTDGQVGFVAALGVEEDAEAEIRSIEIKCIR